MPRQGHLTPPSFSNLEDFDEFYVGLLSPPGVPTPRLSNYFLHFMVL
jgi:hypothetical protein